jgi:plastocyanin
MPINFPNTPSINNTYTSENTTWIWNGSVWNVVTSSTAVVIPANNGFQKISVAGQSDVTADTLEDTLTLVAGTNTTITTNSPANSVTISAVGGGATSNSFATIAVSGQNDVVADSPTDILTLIAGSGMTLSTSSANDSITISSTVTSGATSFTQLSDSAGLTVDKFYLPAITMLTVSNNGAAAYRFDQYGSLDNPTIYVINGTTIAFNLAATGHPFLIQTPGGINYNTGLIHVTPTGVVTTGSSAQGKDSGTLYWKIPTDISGGYRYQCGIHAPMVGSITVKPFSTL